MKNAEKKTAKRISKRTYVIGGLVLLLAAGVSGGLLLFRDVQAPEKVREATLVLWDKEMQTYLDAEKEPIVESGMEILQVSEDHRRVVYRDGMAVYYKDGDSVTKILDQGSVMAVTKDCGNVYYTDVNGIGPLHKWTPSGDETLELGEKISTCTSVGFSENEAYRIIVAKDQNDYRGIYLTEMESGETVKISETTYGTHFASVSNDGGVIYESHENLYYADKKNNHLIAEEVKAFAVYEDAGKVIYLKENGTLFVRDIRAEAKEKQIDAEVTGLYTIGKNVRENWQHKMLMEEYDMLYQPRFTEGGILITETAIDGALYRKDGGSWYVDLNTAESGFLAQKDPNAPFFALASEERMYYTGESGAGVYPEQLYVVERSGDTWAAKRIAAVGRYTDSTHTHLFNNRKSVLYEAEDDVIYAYQNGTESKVAENVEYLYGYPQGTQIVYGSDGVLYYKEKPAGEAVMIADDAIWGIDMWRGGPCYYDGAVYYMNAEEQVIKATVDGKKKEVLLEDAQFFMLHWEEK